MRRLHLQILAVAFLAAALGDSAKAVHPAESDSLLRFTRSESKALGYSLLCTLLPAPTTIFTIPGLVFGPSAGYFYGGCPKRALSGIAIRSLILVGVLSRTSEYDRDFDTITIRFAGLVASRNLVRVA